MPEPIDTTILDPETLARMDEEFRAGTLANLNLPPVEPIDPTSDPFGTGYEWLDEAGEFSDAFARLAAQFPSDYFRTASAAFRRLNPADAAAAGTDEELLAAWVRDSFPVLCRSSRGDLAERIRVAPGPSAGLTSDVARLLGKLPGFDELEPDRQVAVALAVTDLARRNLPPTPPGPDVTG